MGLAGIRTGYREGQRQKQASAGGSCSSHPCRGDCGMDGAPEQLWLVERNAGILRCAQNDDVKPTTTTATANATAGPSTPLLAKARAVTLRMTRCGRGNEVLQRNVAVFLRWVLFAFGGEHV